MPRKLQFEWDEANTTHIARHGISPAATEQVVQNDPLELGTIYHGKEFRTLLIGPTDSGRLLAVVITWRGQKIRVITAYPASRRHRSIYESRQENYEE